jgi:hypothetical protein
MRARARKLTPPLEERERLFIKKLFERNGYTVVNFSQAQKAQQTPGIADLKVYDNRTRHTFWFEVKRQQGPDFLSIYGSEGTGQSDAQKDFQALVESHHEEYVLGSRHAAEAYLRELGRIV